MTIDERLDKLTERHEALTQYLELTSHEWHERFTGLAQATIDQRSSIAEIARMTNDHGKQIGELGGIVRQSASTIETLGRIAEMYENRLDELEGT